MLRTTLKKIVPQRFARYMQKYRRQLAIDKAMRAFCGHPIGAVPSKSLLREVVHAWDNDWSAQWEYLTAIFQTVGQTTGPILECGSGLTTLLVGHWCNQMGRRLYSLEHDPLWATCITRLLARYRIDSVYVNMAPIINSGSFDWYDISEIELPIGFDLVLCDGPPGDVRGGRIGLLEQMRGHLTHNCVVLLDDAARPGEKEVLKLWASAFKVLYRLEGLEKPFAIVTLN